MPLFTITKKNLISSYPDFIFFLVPYFKKVIIQRKIEI